MQDHWSSGHYYNYYYSGMIVTVIASVSTVSLDATRKRDCVSVMSTVVRLAILATLLSVTSVTRQRISRKLN